MDRFAELIIPRSIVESLSQQEVGELMVGFTWRSRVWKQPRKLIQMGLIQLVGAGIIFMAGILPIDRAISLYSPSTTQHDRNVKLILVNGTLTLVILSGINFWIFYRGQRLQSLLKLVEKIERYNQIVRSIETLITVTNLTTPTAEFKQLSLILDILTQTRHHLLAGLKIDRYLRQQTPAAELTNAFVESAPNQIAQNLIALQHLAGQPQLAEYAHLLTQAWEIGISVDALARGIAEEN